MSDSAISVRGLLRNMLDSGFNTVDSIGEKIDDSSGAGAKHIRISVDTKDNKLIFADDGFGMNEEGLRDHGTLHNRKPPSNDKQGRYGIGGNHAEAEFTQLKGSSLTLTKCEEVVDYSHAEMHERTIANRKEYYENHFKGMYELTLDYKKAVENNSFSINPHHMSVVNVKHWNKHAIDPKKKGTVKIYDCPTEIIKKIADIINSKMVHDSLRYYIGSAYFKEIQEGLRITLRVDAEEYAVAPINPLCWDDIAAENKREIPVKVYMNPKDEGDVRLYFKDKGKLLRRIFTGKGNTDKNEEDKPLEGWKHLGNLTIRSTHSKEWSSLQKKSLELNGVELITSGTGVQEFRAKTGGINIMRNRRIVATFPVPKPKSGDKARYDYISEYARHIVQFNPVKVNPITPNVYVSDTDTTMDTLFGVQVNKSKLEKNLINQHVWKNIEWLCVKFAGSFYSLDKSSSSESEAEVRATPVARAPVATVAPVPRAHAAAPPAHVPTPPAAVAADAPVAPTHRAPVTVNAPVAPAPVAPAPVAPAPVAPATVTANAPRTTVRETPAPPAPAPPARAQPVEATGSSSIIVTSSTTPVGPSNRSTSKSQKDFIALAMHMKDAIGNSNINEVFGVASTNTEPGLAELCKDMDKILTKLKQCGVKFL